MNVLRNVRSYIPDGDIDTNPNWEEIKKIRYVEIKTNYAFISVDSKESVTKYEHHKDLSRYDLVVISDYNKGFLDEEDIRRITLSHPLVFLDTKKILGDWADGAAFVKINDFEFQRSLPHMSDLLKSKTIHTMGGLGCEYQSVRFPVQPVEVKDSSGAGDSFLAALVVKYAETGDIEKSIEFANLLAAKVVSERGVTTI